MTQAIAAQTSRTIKVLMADDTVDIANLFARLIDSQTDMACVGVIHTATQLVDEVIRLQPDIVVLDLTMPGKPPLHAMSDLAIVSPTVRVLAFSGYDDEATKRRVFEAGAWGLVSKNGSPGDVLNAIRQIYRGETAL